MSTFQTYSPLLSLETKRKNEEKKDVGIDILRQKDKKERLKYESY